MQENKIFETLLDVIPFASYAVDVNTHEVVYANKLMEESMYAPRADECWKKLYGQEEKCSWCKTEALNERPVIYQSEKLVSSFFNEATDKWFQSYDEIVKWPDGRTVKYTILVDITEQKEIQANMITTHAKMARQSIKLKEANQKLKFLAQKDSLTGVNNRGHFFELLNDIWDKELSEGENIYVAMLDLDKFKNVNDTYGHKRGDEILKLFTSAVKSHLELDTIFGRIGGEEFALVLVDKNKENVVSTLQQIREDVANISIINENDTIKITVSIGLSQKIDKKTIDIVLDEADKELYKAKEDGRNNIKFRV